MVNKCEREIGSLAELLLRVKEKGRNGKDEFWGDTQLITLQDKRR